MRRISSSGLGPDVAPHVTSRPPRASARMLPAQVAAPTFSITTSTPRFSVMPQTSLEKSCALWLISTSAPIALARSSFSWLLEVTKTRAPTCLAICSAASATPPPIPRMSTDSPGRTTARAGTVGRDPASAIGAADVGEGYLGDAAVAGKEVQVVEGGRPKRDQHLTGAGLRGWRVLVAEHLGATVLVKSNRLHVAS